MFIVNNHSVVFIICFDDDFDFDFVSVILAFPFVTHSLMIFSIQSESYIAWIWFVSCPTGRNIYDFWLFISLYFLNHCHFKRAEQNVVNVMLRDVCLTP